MAGVYLLAFVAGLLLEVNGLPVVENTGGVFVSQQAASAVLIRQRRYNSGKLEEVLYKDNLERECREETCTMEEAREFFEDDEKTMEFWARYQDGNQCNPSPCLNEGECQDGIGSYVCWCKAGFNGKNCEIEVSRQCSVNNGGCSHFCEMKEDVVVCRCAAGYRLGADRQTCEPTEQFSCGRVHLSSTAASIARRRRSSPPSAEKEPDLSYDYSDTNETEIYDYADDFTANDTDLVHSARPPRPDVRSVRPGTEDANATDPKPTLFPLWGYFATLPSITAKDNLDQRIVGGDEAAPGQIPWQVALMSHSEALQRAEPFCGGSLLSDTWVITAAHCLMEAKIKNHHFFVRVGEHDVNVVEDAERDHTVLEQHLHFMYDYGKSPYDHDIALLKLATPVELSSRRSPICLGPKSFIEKLLRDSTGSLVSGWGRLHFRGREATKLQKLEVPYVDRTRCKQSSREHVTPFMFCAGFQTEAMDSCQGDSGGPHATPYNGTWFLTGIVSWGEECAKDGKYGIYTRVARYYRWISKTTGIRIN